MDHIFHFIIILFLHTYHHRVTTLQYEKDVSYEYKYSSEVIFTESNVDKSQVAFKISSTVKVKSIWQNGDMEQLLLLTMEPQVLVKPKGKNNLEVHPSLLDSVISNPVLFVLNRGRITHFYGNLNEDLDLLNLKRGVVSLFQLQQVSGDTHEIDASGKCLVFYATSGRTTTKVKKSCECNSQVAPNFSHTQKVLDTDLKSERKTIYQLTADDYIIQTAENEEIFQYSVNAILSTSATVISKQKLSLLKQIQEENPFEGSTVQQIVESVSKNLNNELSFIDITLLESQRKPLSTTLSTIVRKQKEGLSNKRIATLKAANGVFQLLNYFRRSSKAEITSVLKDPKNKNIISSLLDVAAAAQTSEAFDSALEFIKKIHNPDIVERFLLALAVVPRPSEKMIQRLQEMIANQEFKEQKIEETAILMLGSLIRSHCKINKDNCENKVIKDAISSLSVQLEHCQDNACYLTFLRAIRNAGQSSTIPVLIDCIHKSGKISIWALQTLKEIPSHYINAKIRKLMMQVYNQLHRRYPSTSRLHAADILLENEPSDEEIKDITRGLYEANEFSTYLLARLKELIKTNYKLRNKLSRILKQKNLNNYNVLSQPGISTAFTSILGEKDQTNVTYTIHIEIGKGGILKQSIFDMNVNQQQSSLPLFGFGIFASGLSGLANEVNEDDEGEATAGIELAVMNVALRPYVFFVGQADLMSHVWSGTASEPTNILMGNFLLQDSHERLALSSGFILDFTSRGVASIDISGALQVSLWNRNAHSDITTKVATVIQGSASINSNLVSLSLLFSSSSEGNLSFVTDTEFYESPVKMCTQMLQPSFPIRSMIQKTENIPNTKHRLRRTKRRTEKILGKCLALHPKNDALCGVMLEE